VRFRLLHPALLMALALLLLPLTASAASAERLVATEDDATNSFLSTTCNQNAADAIFTSGTFTATGPIADQGVVITSLLTGAAADGVAPNQVAGSSEYLGAHSTAFINFSGQLKCDSAISGRITSVVGTLYLYDTAGGGVTISKFSAAPRASSVRLDFTHQTLAEDFSGALGRAR
jgi:hypothetical protein